MSDALALYQGLLFLVVVVGLYLVPLIVALNRQHPQRGMIAVINIFLGWTLIGWVVALAIACSAINKTRPAAAGVAQSAGAKVCPACAETVKAAARVCRFCGHQFEPKPAAPGPTGGPRPTV